ncbi:MAG: hypothetical protein ACC645_11650 [Pirellulales bacterium]
MPIDVICPGCHARFKVSDKFGGKKGPCPKCKELIRVPDASEKVVIHAPEHSEAGAKDATGQYVLKPIEREETKVPPLVVAGIVALALVVIVLAFLLRGVEEKRIFLAVGAIVLAPPLVLGGYTFLRNDELAPYTGRSLAVRTLLCSAVYAALWGAYTYAYFLMVGDAPVVAWNVLPLAVAILFVGGGTAFVCYDLDLGSGVFHYCFYLLITVLLRMAMGLPPV